MSLFDVEGKVVLVTGGGRGIGKMIAEGFVRQGARVYISSRKKEACDAAAAELSSLGPGTCVSLPTDLSTDSGCRHLASLLGEHESKLHVLVNNSGTSWGAS